MEPAGRTYLLIDGENIDGALGSILGRKPSPESRPRWQQLLVFAEQLWNQPARGLFFINASKGLHEQFVQALMAMDYRPIPLTGTSNEKVVDIGIQRMMAAILDRGGDVLLASHDADFAAGMRSLADVDRRVGVVGFPELLSHELRELARLEIVDLELDVHAFEMELPRVRIISLDAFDPYQFL
jgi:putative heme uptake system protein